MLLNVICFYYIYLTPTKPMGSEDPDSQAGMVVLSCALNAVILATFIWWADWPKELMGISSNANFWPIFKVFGSVAGIWTFLGFWASPIYYEKVKNTKSRQSKKMNREFKAILQRCVDKHPEAARQNIKKD